MYQISGPVRIAISAGLPALLNPEVLRKIANMRAFKWRGGDGRD